MNIKQMRRVVGVLALTGAVLAVTSPIASADQIRKEQWALKAFSAEDVWKEATGKGVTVAVLDSGVKRDHPDIKQNVLPGLRVASGGPADEQAADHGTSMASLIAGHGHGPGGKSGIKGLAPDAKILPIDIYEDARADKAASGQLVDGLRYAVDNGAKVINSSTGQLGRGQRVNDEIAYALNKGVVIVSSAGNTGSEGLVGLAAHPGVVTVGAVDQGLKRWDNSRRGAGLTLSAPGTNIRAADVDGEYRRGEGTSNSAAYVSAALALIFEKYPDLTPGQAVNRLTETALMPEHAKGRKVPDKEYGYGIIRPHRALIKDIPQGPKNGPLDVPPPPKDKSSSLPDLDSPGADYEPKATSGEDSNMLIFAIGGGVAALAVLGVGTFVLVNRSKRRRAATAPPHGPDFYDPPPSHVGHPPPSHPPRR